MNSGYQRLAMVVMMQGLLIYAYIDIYFFTICLHSCFTKNLRSEFQKDIYKLFGANVFGPKHLDFLGVWIQSCDSHWRSQLVWPVQQKI